MSFGTASSNSLAEVELLIGCEGFIAYQFQTNSECRQVFLGSESSGANVRWREGKSPDQQLRPPNVCQVERTMCGCSDSQDVSLEAAIHLKSAQQLTSRATVRGQQSGIKHTAEAMESEKIGRGAFYTAMKVRRKFCWSVQKRRCRHKQRQCRRETCTPKTQGFLINVNRIRVSQGLRLSRRAIPMDNWLIFQYLNILRWRDEIVTGTRTYGIVRQRLQVQGLVNSQVLLKADSTRSLRTNGQLPQSDFREKLLSFRYIQPVPQTDTGTRDENSKALE
eukprot:TRINITY_DN4319_c0_g2_i3.p1 TRINITY_DN4319_c0_g2~~TRINITY_DN4319_c0_g2_i3.p1  ORF type:complete len:278 (-),score=-93.85 TRINITY_DN4319_c0_g2_i3:147-980(-)